MSKRERIIVAVMVVAVLYGAYSFLFERSAPPPSSTAEQNAPLDQFVTQIAVQINRADTTDRARYILERASHDVDANPLLAISTKTEQALAEEAHAAQKIEGAASAPSADQFTYTGYIRMDGRLIAVINGLEYAEGDLLADGAYTVSRIETDQVMIVDNETRQRVTIPSLIQEEIGGSDE